MRAALLLRTLPPLIALWVAPAPDDDASRFGYLEDIYSDRAIAFAKAHTARAEGELGGDAGFRALEERILAIRASQDRIPSVSAENGKLRNFWTDKEHPRGVWRETTLAEFEKPDPVWTPILDIDALNKAEGRNDVYKGAQCLPPLYEKCLIRLSHGGGDAFDVREFDAAKRVFVKGGFEFPGGYDPGVAKSSNGRRPCFAPRIWRRRNTSRRRRTARRFRTSK